MLFRSTRRAALRSVCLVLRRISFPSCRNAPFQNGDLGFRCTLAIGANDSTNVHPCLAVCKCVKKPVKAHVYGCGIVSPVRFRPQPPSLTINGLRQKRRPSGNAKWEHLHQDPPLFTDVQKGPQYDFVWVEGTGSGRSNFRCDAKIGRAHV